MALGVAVAAGAELAAADEAAELAGAEEAALAELAALAEVAAAEVAAADDAGAADEDAVVAALPLEQAATAVLAAAIADRRRNWDRLRPFLSLTDNTPEIHRTNDNKKHGSNELAMAPS